MELILSIFIIVQGAPVLSLGATNYLCDRSHTQEQPQQGRADGPTSGILKAKVCFCFVP